MALQQQALKVAISQLGQHENPLGSNWGKPVQDYLKSVNISFPASWCMAFVYWCFEQTGQSNPLVRTGGVLNAWNTADKKFRVVGGLPAWVDTSTGGGMVNPMTTQGDIIYGGASGTPTRLAAGTANYVLQANGAGAAPSWVALAGGGNALTSNPLSQFASTTSAQFMGVISDETGGSGVVVGSSSPTIDAPNLTGLTVTNNILPGTQFVTSAGTTTTLVASSTYRTIITGSSAQTVKLPLGTSLRKGQEFYIDNNSSVAASIQDNGANVLFSIQPNHDAFFVISDTSTTNGTWDINAHGNIDLPNTWASTQTVPTLNATTIVATAGTFQNMVVQTTGTAATWTVPAALQVTGAKWKITIIGAGGGGGGTNTTAGQVGGGGASGGVVVYYCTWVAGQTTMTYTVGAAGIASATNAAGGTGGNTSITYNAVTITANGGVGGPSSTAAAGAAGGSAAGGTLNLAGNNGTPSGTMAATNNLQGNGANTPLGYGSGGQEVFTAAGGNGLTGQGYGSGGSGGKNGTGTTARTGAAGTGGLIIIEY